MSLPSLYVQPQDTDAWRAWSFNHSANHFDMLAAAQEQKNVTGLQQFILDPMDLNNLGQWLYNHQVMHNQLNAALGTQGFNLLGFDWEDPQQFSMWLRLNGDEHVRLSAALGVG